MSDGTIETLSIRENHEDGDAGVVALVRYVGDIGGHGPVGVNLDYLESMVEQCREMDWGEVTLFLREDDLVLARERGVDDSDVFVALAPYIPADELEGEDGR